MSWFIVSVGISLISKNKKYNKKWGDVSDKEEDWNEYEQTYMNYLNSFVVNKNKENDLVNASAELSSLFKKGARIPNEGDTIILLSTDTKPSKGCSENIIRALNLMNFYQVFDCTIEKLSEASVSSFFDQGLPNLIRKLYELIVEARRVKEDVVLVPTGGYKAIIPYYIHMGILMNVPCQYVYEESDQVMELPPLPLHVDLSEWTTIESVIEGVTGKPIVEVEKWKAYEAKKRELHNLLIREKECYQPSPLCKLLQERVEKDRRRPELLFRTQNSPLLPYLIKNGDKTLQKKFLRLAAIGPYIWKGDRVPEMADHALLHHADLFHLAERILLPVFYFYELKKGEPFLTPEELFILMGALHLHDCGHVVSKVDFREHRLLPTEVRDFHHILGFLRLTEPEAHGGTGRWIHNALKGPIREGAGEEAWNEEDLTRTLLAIAVIGLYHRKKVNLVQGDEPSDFIQGEKWKNNPLKTIPCLLKFLEENPIKINSVTIEGEPVIILIKAERVKLLISLLRIIDSLDEQGARTGGKEAVDFHLQQLENEAREEDVRADGLQSALNSVENLLPPEGRMACSRVIKLDTLVDRLFSAYIGGESKVAQNMVSKEDLPWSFWEGFKKIFPSDNDQRDPLEPLGLEYAISRIAAKFKRFQKEPYEEKIHVEYIKIAHHFENGDIWFDIDLKGDSSFSEDERSELLGSMAKEYLKEEKINNEKIPVVQKTLKKAGIVLNYQR